MTPEEKAKYLISINSVTILSVIGNKLSMDEVKEIAKQFALITVDEIINIGCIEVPYWLEVKQEIEKL
jgi:hypothetical protein